MLKDSLRLRQVVSECCDVFFFFLLLTFRYLSTFAEQLRNPLEVLTILGEEKKENGRREDGTRSLDNK